jgi:hypothetical protein
VRHRVKWRKVKLKTTAAVALMLILLLGPASANTLCGLMCAGQREVASVGAHPHGIHSKSAMALRGHAHHGLTQSTMPPASAHSNSCRSECSLQPLAGPSRGEVENGRQQGSMPGMQSPACLLIEHSDYKVETCNQPPGSTGSLLTVLRV